MILQSERVWTGSQFIPAQLELENGKICRILPKDSLPYDVDYGHLRVVPGFIDIHTHGAYGFDTNDGEEEGLRLWLRRIPEEGVTGLCPTTITQSTEILCKALQNVAAICGSGYEGAEILGVHLEGPFLSVKYKGAQPEEYIVPPSIEGFKRFQEAAGGRIKVITLAPEVDEGFALTRYCSQNGVAVSMGHSQATYRQAVLAAANGARSFTHVFNGMSPFNHREPGLAGAAFRLRDTFGEMICDGNHIDYGAVGNYFAAKGKDYGILITDSLQAKGCPKATYLFGGNEITIGDDGAARLNNGVLAGSTLRVNEGLRNLVEYALVPFETALNACTRNPARLLGLENRKGSITAGLDADLAVLEEDYTVAATWCQGNLCYSGA